LFLETDREGERGELRNPPPSGGQLRIEKVSAFRVFTIWCPGGEDWTFVQESILNASFLGGNRRGELTGFRLRNALSRKIKKSVVLRALKKEDQKK